ncbi:MAG: SpoIIE family protein phosphatase, partial [Armatimonadota bacterium]|nr:SpoIIE family protein phosphatase [Armatimonadota bacterium]
TSVVSGSPPEEWHKIAWTTHRIRALHSAPRQADDSSSDAGLVIGSPLIAGDRSVGVLVVRFAEEDFAEDDSQWQLFELLRAFGSYAAVALQNARSFARTEDYSRSLAAWLDELSALRYVTEAITASLDLREILQTLARLSCDVMKAHACAIMMMDNSGQLTISEAHNISSQVWDLCACRIGEPVSGIAAAEKRPIPCRDMPADYPDLKIARYARDHGLHGFLSVPLISGREAIGTIDVWMEEPCDFTAYQMDLLSSIAAHAAMAIQNARLFGKEYRIAETLQSVILGGIPENHAGLELGCKYAPALDEARVGGDFYDFVPLPGGKLGVVIADVSGKGLEAAMHTAMCKYMLRGFAYHMPDSPGRVLEMVNDALCGYSSFRFYVTMLYCVIDPAVGSLKCANAGHPPAILISDSGQRQVLLYQTGMPVGFETGKSYQEKTVRLSVEDMLILYTDGLIEARRGTETLGIEGLQEMLFSAAEEQDPQALVERIYSETLQYAKDGVRDDMAIVAVRVDEGFERVERVERVEVQGRDSNF